MSLGNQTIHRIYTCLNCKGQIAYKEQVKDKWRKKCPFCNKNSLLLDKAVLSLSTIIGLNESKTFLSLAQKNTERRNKELGIKKKKKPFWRKKDKVNFEVLKNPTKYVNEGYT
jgi:DNA-directed RNA polymerase subunit RPC12/RpoP